MSTYKDLMTVCCAAVLALGLAACGSSSDNDQADTGMDGDGMEMPEPAGPSAADLFKVAQDSRSDAMAAGEAAETALETATDADDKLDTDATAGDSGTAMANAQAILDAQTDAAQAVMDAEDAKEAAEEAKTAAADLDDGELKDSLIEALDEAIEEAEEAIKTATDIRDGRDLEAAGEAVTGTDGKGTPRSIADAVGMSIASGLLPGTNNGRARGAHGATAPVPADVKKEHRVVMDDAKGHTWAEIVGEDNLMRMPVGTDNAGVMVASFAGMARSAIDDTDLADDATTGTDGAGYDGSYKGIAGTVHCLGTDCKVEDGKLTGSWYFAPTSTTIHYVSNPDKDARAATPYTARPCTPLTGIGSCSTAPTGTSTRSPRLEVRGLARSSWLPPTRQTSLVTMIRRPTPEAPPVCRSSRPPRPTAWVTTSTPAGSPPMCRSTLRSGRVRPCAAPSTTSRVTQSETGP